MPDLNDQVSKYFTFKEALWLPTWNRSATESDGLSDQIVRNLSILFGKMDKVRDLVGQPILVNCAYRPYVYNKLVGGAPASAHTQGQACDWRVNGVDCDTLRSLLLPHLEEWNMRMEDLPGSNWVHLDYRQVAAGGNRFFKP
jgi:uncharacterized protein YcbK (DUF882 family)